MAKELDEQVERFPHPPARGRGPFTLLAADALLLKVREGGQVVAVHVLAATRGQR